MINIADIHDCFGCGVCAKACPKQIIALKLNKNGFYEPRIESADQCIKCSICVEVCAFAADSQVIDLKPTSYAAWSLNDDIRKNSSSGGIAFEIGRQMLQQGFKICVVRYNYAKQIPEHYIARNEEELAASAGSKYLQSDTTDGFAGIDIHDKYVVTGTPCQIASFRRYIRRFRVESNFILVDFFCHGSVDAVMAKIPAHDRRKRKTHGHQMAKQTAGLARLMGHGLHIFGIRRNSQRIFSIIGWRSFL